VTDSTGRSLFVTADDLDTKDWLGDDRDTIAQGLIGALDTARRLRHDAHLGFVVAPLAAGDGRPTVRFGDRYAISVYPWLEGKSHPFGHQTGPIGRDVVLDMLIALHTVDPPAGTPHNTRPHVGARQDLEAFLHEPADPWNEGPFGEQARALFAPHVEQLIARLDHFDRATQPPPTRVAVTHGEPHGGNLMSVGDVVVLIDWDTVGLAAPERDLWLVDLDDAATSRYTEATGHQPDTAILALYRERWLLDDIGHLVQFFRGHHDTDSDAYQWLRALPALLDSLPTAGSTNW